MTAAERRAQQAFRTGTAVDFRQAADEDPEQGGGWGPERTVRAEVIQELLLSGTAAEGEIAGLRLVGARVTGRLNLRYGAVEHPVSLRCCHFDQTPFLYGAEIRQLNLSDSYLPALDAATIRVGGVLRITGCRIPGEVRLGGARIGGAFFLDAARLGDEQGLQDAALQLNHATIEDDLWAPGVRVRGEVRLRGARIGGAVNLDDADLSIQGGTALNIENLTVGSNLHAKGMSVRGRFELRGAQVPGQFILSETLLSNPGGVAFRASSCVIGELWLRCAVPIEGQVNLRRSQLDLLYVPPEITPGTVRLDGLTFAALEPHLPAEDRLDLLSRDVDGYVPYAYEQLTAAYRRVGDEAGARTVQLVKQRRHRITLPWYAKIWGYLQDATVGYGFRPMRAAAWLLALLLTGAIAYGLHHPSPLKPGEAPDFDPFFYTLDLLLPIISFGQEGAFKPAGGYQVLSHLLVLAGWILATTIAAGITRAVSRQ